MKKEKVSIIIPCKEIDKYTKKCINQCLKLNCDNFEIIVLPDKKQEINTKNKNLKIISCTGKPSLKRNLGMKISKGEYYAFIDSDAYPEKNWLKNAIKHFQKKDVGLVGGPNLTPKESNFWEKISGKVLSNFLVSGIASIRYKKTRNQFTKELPSCNYIVKKELATKYSQEFLTAEDSEFCFNITKKGKKILYANDVIVYHHRRDSFFKHLKQIFIYSRDIAWLTKKEFSFDKLYYSILSLFTLAFISGIILSFIFPLIKTLFLIFLVFYLLIIFITSFHKNIKTSLAVFVTSILTHFSYGFGWLYGIFVRQR